MNDYCRIQKGIIRPILLMAAAACLASTWFVMPRPTLPVFFACAVVCLVFSFAFGHLMVRGNDNRLEISFGPLVLFRKTIAFSEITHVEKERSSFFAGWGIHWTRKGWLWNIRGYDCVRIETGAKSTLVGTDDPDGLISFLKSKTGL
jgi:hypothetical protein